MLGVVSCSERCFEHMLLYYMYHCEDVDKEVCKNSLRMPIHDTAVFYRTAWERGNGKSFRFCLCASDRTRTGT